MCGKFETSEGFEFVLHTDQGGARLCKRTKSLQFLDVSFCKSLQSLPEWIGELKCLSYFNVEWCSKELIENYIRKGISQLSSLRILRSGFLTLAIEESQFLGVREVGNLINVKEIRFGLRDVSGLRSLDDGVLDRLVKIRILGVQNNIPAFPDKMKVMKDLQQLSIVCFFVPSWLCGMEYLTDLFLKNCSDYPSLQKMPNL